MKMLLNGLKTSSNKDCIDSLCSIKNVLLNKIEYKLLSITQTFLLMTACRFPTLKSSQKETETYQRLIMKLYSTDKNHFFTIKAQFGLRKRATMVLKSVN